MAERCKYPENEGIEQKSKKEPVTPTLNPEICLLEVVNRQEI
jgi:hypothetical protein